MSANDPVAWANKRKAAMENAKKLREARKNGEQEEAPSFTPQVNKRPSYLKQTDSLDKLAGAINIDTNDIFEKPLPGHRAAQAVQNDYSKQNLPSPGSDTLGKEVKRYGQNEEIKPVYKSKFLQQYENEHTQEDDYEEPAPTRQHSQVPPQRSNPPAQRGYQSPGQTEEVDDQFMHSLRGNGASAGKKGWNDDITADGFAPASALRSKTSATKPRARQNTDYEDEPNAYAPKVPVGGRRAQQPKQQGGEWNMDTEVSYAPPPALPPKASPRSAPQRRAETDGAASQARPNLSLLKSKIRRSESGKNVHAMDNSDSTSSFNNTYSDRDNGGSSAAEKVADIRNNGRRSAPNPSRNPPSNMQNQYRDEEQDEEHAYVPSQIAGRSRGAAVAAKPVAQRPAFKPVYDEEDDPYGPDAYPPGGGPPPRGQVAAQQPKAKPVVQNRRVPADSRFDPDPEDDPYGPDAYPPGARGQPAAQSKPKAQPVVQARRAAPADSRFDSDPYGPDAYPPGGGPPGRSQPVAQAQARAKAAPVQQPRRAPPPQAYEEDPYGPDAYPPGGGPPAEMPSEYADDDGEQRQCPHCERKFNPIPYAKHIKICEKVFIKKRKVFDSTKMRISAIDDPEAQKILLKAAKEAARQAAIDKKNAAKNGGMGGGGGGGGGANAPIPVAKARAPTAPVNQAGPAGGEAEGKWKQQSNAFRDAMKAARQYTKAVAEGKPLPPPVASAIDTSMIPCPTCGRRFSQKAGERHIPQCKNIIAKPQALKRGAGGGGGVNGTAAVTAGAAAGKGRGRF